MAARDGKEAGMSNPPAHESDDNDIDDAEFGGESEVDADTSATTMRQKALKLESELWPDEEDLDGSDNGGKGFDPYDTGRFVKKK